tara:strand:- start:671 stop:1564 length:894 start_codon:yes stop_codon:yes gene_type:complete
MTEKEGFNKLGVTEVDVLIASFRRPALLEQALCNLQQLQNLHQPDLLLNVHVIDEAMGSGAGPAAARNQAALAGSSEFIAILDDDDQWTEHRLQRSIAILQQEPEVVLVCGDMEVPARGLDSILGARFTIPEQGLTLDHRDLSLDCFVCTSTVTMRRADWEQAGGMREELSRAEDYDLWLRLTARGGRIRLLPDRLARYGVATERLSDDVIAMLEATRSVLEQSSLAPLDASMRTRLGRLDAALSHQLSARNSPLRALRHSIRALRQAPFARLCWSSLARALLSCLAVPRFGNISTP